MSSFKDEVDKRRLHGQRRGQTEHPNCFSEYESNHPDCDACGDNIACQIATREARGTPVRPHRPHSEGRQVAAERHSYTPVTKQHNADSDFTWPENESMWQALGKNVGLSAVGVMFEELANWARHMRWFR